MHFNTDQHPQCKFPARFKLLKENSTESFPTSKCPAYDEWLATLDPQGASLVFAGNYPDNPGSIFGHTFLKVKTSSHSRLQSKGKQHSEILDYALNYAAAVDDTGSFMYAMKGIFGGYYGFFSMDPYYVKINDYSEGEGRDIWEYELAFDQKDAQFLLAHFWEVRYQAKFKYYFLDDNCSFLVLKLIDATKPEWKVVTSDPPYVIPIETVKELKEFPGAIKSTHYRPSVRKKAENSYKNLNPIQKHETIKLLHHELSPAKITDANVLNTVVLSLFSKRSKNNGALSTEDKLLQDGTLIQLSTLDTSKLTSEVENQGDPSKSHKVKQVGLGFGYQQKAYGELSFRPGLHDMTDFQRGYLDYSELEVADIHARIKEDQFTIHNIDLFNLGLYRPTSLQENSFSWRTRWAYQNQSQIFCEFCKSVYGEAAVGYAYHLYPKLLTYIMFGGFLNAGAIDTHELKSGGMSEIGTISNFTEKTRLLFAISSYLNLTNTTSGRTLYRVSVQGTYNIDKDIDVNLTSHSGLQLSGSEKFESDVQASIDFHF
ncbi:Lnb N-terminal periplasmic domain-containing protein [Peredibacter starrii]|uniref:DUF4105 domain-containing protein n=1 Tax=Peredibacter starrii TaxID=28202 RepID=A0AAX4HNE0_9BACT|nr:DUF4105 domain-containing protein [Peredibacter starrii]WPU64434.1 DUF4105 domain-containing protein [Peredibacter starrii]